MLRAIKPQVIAVDAKIDLVVARTGIAVALNPLHWHTICIWAVIREYPAMAPERPHGGLAHLAMGFTL